jgi:hypothetical protein
MRPLLVKALLMGGASKAPWNDWHRGLGSRIETNVPLDHRYGAGQLNVDRSFRILEGGRQIPDGVDVSSIGWDCNRASARVARRYMLDVHDPARNVSILLAWHRHVAVAREYPLVLGSTLANLDLKLYRVGARGHDELIDSSTSRVDNVEHIFLRDLAAGRYKIEVSTDRESEYALTWDAQQQIHVPSNVGLLAQSSNGAAPENRTVRPALAVGSAVVSTANLSNEAP